jgi:hypothetical protein
MTIYISLQKHKLCLIAEQMVVALVGYRVAAYAIWCTYIVNAVLQVN